MGGWAGCDALMSAGATAGLAAGVVCAALAAFLVAAIALGFGVLRARLAPTLARRPSPGSDCWDGGLLDAWRLYRRVGPVERGGPAPALGDTAGADEPSAREQRLASARP